jgi:ribosomal protein S18 acetylase RimI-like enzyme
MDTFLAALRARGVPGVHLGTSERNERACRFYARCGFEEYARGGGGVTFVMELEREAGSR